MKSEAMQLYGRVRLLAVLLIGLLLPLAPARATVVELDFGGLPSAQGWTFLTGVTPPIAAESDVFSLAGGVLTMDTRTALSGFYALADVPVAGVPFALDVRARVLESVGAPLSFNVGTSVEEFVFALAANALVASDGGIVLLDATVFHDYRMEGDPGGNFRLFVDGALAAAGTALPGALPDRFLAFGDLSPTSRTGLAEITAFRFTQNVPAPATLALALVGLAILRLVPAARRRA